MTYIPASSSDIVNLEEKSFEEKINDLSLKIEINYKVIKQILKAHKQELEKAIDNNVDEVLKILNSKDTYGVQYRNILRLKLKKEMK